MSEQKPAIQKQTESFGTVTREQSAELAAVAVAAAAKAEVEAAYIMALRKPRNEEDARLKILNVCKNVGFAEKAIYSKPVSGKAIRGPSIRFAEEVLRHWQNVKSIQIMIFDDPFKRIIKNTMIDLESNVSYSEDIVVEKTVERHNVEDREVVGVRTNTSGKRVSIVTATEDEINNKKNALGSKSIRNNGLRLIPDHIIDEAMDICFSVLKERVSKDPDAEKRKIFDAFNELGIKPSEIEKYLKHPASQITPAELITLRQVYNTLKEGSARWSDYVPTISTEERPVIPTKKKEEPKAAEPSVVDKSRANEKQIAQLERMRQQVKISDVAFIELCEAYGGFPDKMSVSVYKKLLQELALRMDEMLKDKPVTTVDQRLA